MELRSKVFGHNKNRPRQMYAEGTVQYEVSEIAYECFLELTSVAYSAINRAYPKLERDKNPKVEYLWRSGHEQAKDFLTRYKNIVRDCVIPLAKITKHKEEYDDSTDRHTQEFKKLIVDNNFYMLYDKLKAFAPLMVPKEHLEGFTSVLETTYNSVKEKLLANLAHYEAEGTIKE